MCTSVPLRLYFQFQVTLCGHMTEPISGQRNWSDSSMAAGAVVNSSKMAEPSPRYKKGCAIDKIFMTDFHSMLHAHICLYRSWGQKMYFFTQRSLFKCLLFHMLLYKCIDQPLGIALYLYQVYFSIPALKKCSDNISSLSLVHFYQLNQRHTL